MVISIFCNHPNPPLTWTHLYGALVVMGYIKEHRMGDGGHQWAETGLNKSSDWLASVTVDQSAFFMAVASGHGLCGQVGKHYHMIHAAAALRATSHIQAGPQSNQAMHRQTYLQ